MTSVARVLTLAVALAVALSVVLLLALLLMIHALPSAIHPIADEARPCLATSTVREVLEQSDLKDIQAPEGGETPELLEESIEVPWAGDSICHRFRWEVPSDSPLPEGRISIQVYDRAFSAAQYRESVDIYIDHDLNDDYFYGPLRISEHGRSGSNTGSFEASGYIGCVYVHFDWRPDLPTDAEVTAMFDRVTLATLDVSQQVCL
jgi:hypothetical protein